MGEHDGVMTFTGYHTPRPNDDRGSVRLHSSQNIMAISNGNDEQVLMIPRTAIAIRKKTTNN
jgi:hypothetical protein